MFLGKSQGTNRQIDLLQALEMSRLQLLQDMDSLTTGSSSDARYIACNIMLKCIASPNVYWLLWNMW